MRNELFVVSGLLLLGLLTVLAGYFRLDAVSVHLEARSIPTAPLDARYVENPVLSAFHIMTGSALFLLAPLQFSATIRRRWPLVHRYLGRLIVLSAVAVAVSSMLTAWRFPAFGGWLTSTATCAASLWMLFCLWQAIGFIRTRQVSRHREWMTRMFAIALGVSTIRILFIVSEAGFGLPIDRIFAPAFAAGLLFNFLLAEMVISTMRRKR